MVTFAELPDGLALDFQLLFDATPIPYLVLTPDFTMVAANEARLEATNTVREQILGRPLFDVFPDNPADPEATGVANLRASLIRVLQNKRPDAMPIQKYDIPTHASVEGEFEVRYWKPLNTPVFSPSGEIIYIIHCVEDVTEHVLQQQATEESAARFRQIADAIPQMVWSTLPDGYHDYYNQRHYDFAGVALESTIGQNWGAILHPDDLPRTRKAWEHSLATGDPYEIEYRLRHRSGQYHWVLARALPIRNEAGEIERWMGTCTDINEQKILQAKLQDAQLRLEATLTAAEIGTWTWDIQADKVYADCNFAKLFHISKQDANGGPIKAYLNVIHPDDIKAVEANIADALATGKPYQYHYRLCQPDGSIRHVHARGKIEFDASGNPAWMPGVVVDITQQKLAEEARLRTEFKFKTIVDSNVIGIMQYHYDGTLLKVNDAFLRMLGYSREDFEQHGLSWRKLTPPEWENADRRSLESLQSTGSAEAYEKEYFRKNGSRLPVFIGAANDQGAEEEGIAYVLDISESKKAQSALRESEVQFRTLAANIPQLAWMANSDGSIFWYNNRWFEYTGTTLEEMQGWGWEKVHHPDFIKTVKAKYYNNIVKQQIAWEDLFPLRSKSGEYRWFLSRAVPIRDRNGQIVRWFGTNTDVTDQRRTEEALRQSEEKFRATFEHAPLGIAEYAVDGRFTRANPKLLDMLGYTSEEFEHLSVLDVVHPSEAEETLSHFQKLIDGEVDVCVKEKRYVRKDHSIVWVNITASPRHIEGKPQHIIAIIEDVTARKKAEEDLRRALEQSYHLANHDNLTGLANRASFNDRLKDAILYAQRDDHLVAVHFLDLDRFKSINDTLGHHIGDLLLREVAKRIKSQVRATDLVARFGGDEFVIIQTYLANPTAAGVLAEKIVEEVGHPYLLEGQEVRSGTSIGIALYPKDAEDPEQLLKCADLALYEAKNRGRYNYQLYREGMGAAVQDAQRIEQELRRALYEDELTLHYQPQFDLKSGRITGIEALIRWRHPEKGLLAASEFIHDAENANLILPIGEWTLRTACRQHKEWVDAGLTVPLTLNISSKQLRHFHFLEILGRTLEETKLPPSLLQLEIRESALWDPGFSASLLKEIKNSGLLLALDAFGTELTAFSSLHRFPLDVVKPSKELVKELPSQKREATILAAIIGVAHDLEITVCAEGIETADQLAAVKGQGCDSAQGYLLSLPLDADEMERLIEIEVAH